MLTALLTGCSGSTPPAAPSATQIRAALQAHGAAVRAHDRDGFTAGLASGAPADAFRTAQEAEFANLRQLSFRTWSYQLGGRTDDRSVERAATATFGQPAVVYRVTLRYALTGADPTPTQHTLYWTFLRAGDDAVVAGDAALAQRGGASWKGPWDFGPLVIGRGTSTLVLAHATAGDLSTLVTTVDAAVPAVTKVWGTAWPRQVVVLVPASQAELDADTPDAPQVTTRIPAVTVSDGSDPVTRAAYGLRLVVNPPSLGKLSTIGRQITLRHEVTHIAAGSVTSDVTPRWLVEGFADYVGLLTSGQTPRQAAVELGRVVRAGSLPSTLPTDATFDDASTAPLAYEEGWLACRLIAQDAGQGALVRFYHLVSASFDSMTAVPAALQQVLHLSLAGFTARWRSYLRAQLG